MYDFLVIGAGLFGSAAARYLSQRSDKVALIGPAEPTDWAAHQGVFASHYDQGRLAGYYGPDATWTALDQASIDQYVPLQEASGIEFYDPRGLISIPQPGERPRYAFGDSAEIPTYTNTTLPDEIALTIPEGHTAWFEPAPSGYINPRQMIAAQMAVARAQGCTIIRQTVASVTNVGSHVELRCVNGETYQTQKVLLATGAFTNFLDLLPRKLALRIKPETTILARVSQAEAERMRFVPPLNYKIDSDEIHGIYLAPPVEYPDGHYYLKMGCDTRSDTLFTTLQEVQGWFIDGNTDNHKAAMKAGVRELFPDMEVIDWVTRPCVVCYSPFGKPYISAVDDDRIYVAAAGNGSGAHPSDAVGRLAADLMVDGKWTSPLDEGAFKVQFADQWRNWMGAPLTVFD